MSVLWKLEKRAPTGWKQPTESCMIGSFLVAYHPHWTPVSLARNISSARSYTVDPAVPRLLFTKSSAFIKMIISVNCWATVGNWLRKAIDTTKLSLHSRYEIYSHKNNHNKMYTNLKNKRLQWHKISSSLLWMYKSILFASIRISIHKRMTNIKMQWQFAFLIWKERRLNPEAFSLQGCYREATH